MKTEAPAYINSEHKYLTVVHFPALGKTKIDAWFFDPSKFMADTLKGSDCQYQIIEINR